MTGTLDYLESLPLAKTPEMSHADWLTLCNDAMQIANDEIGGLLKQSRAQVRLPLLKKVDIAGHIYATPSRWLGRFLIQPDDDYLRRTHQWAFPGASSVRAKTGVNIEFDLCRRVSVSYFGAEHISPSVVYMRLSVYHGLELDAFREIYDNYRGIVGKLLHMAPIEFSSSGIEEVDKVRSKKPLPKLDAILHLTDPDPDTQTFRLEYPWHRNRSHQQGLRAFRSLAILFTCICKAAASPRSKKDHLLSYYDSIQGE